jgi:D-alanyl-D-alanine carboxypeptidase
VSVRFIGSILLIVVMSINLCEESGAIQPVYSGRTVNEMASEIVSGKPVAVSPQILEVVPPGDSNNTHITGRIPTKSQLRETLKESADVGSPHRTNASDSLLRSARPSSIKEFLNSRPWAEPLSFVGLSDTAVSSLKKGRMAVSRPLVRAKALFCVDCSSNKVVLAENVSEPLPIASITKLLTAVIVIEEMDLDQALQVPADIKEVEKHVVGLKPGDRLSVRDLLHGLLIASGNDCAEVLARSYPKGGRQGFIDEMNRFAVVIGAEKSKFYTPSGLDIVEAVGNKNGRELSVRLSNTASAEDVATIAGRAFGYPLIRKISGMKTYVARSIGEKPRNIPLVSNDRLLHSNLPIVGAKTGFTNLAGRCIVALFKKQDKEHMVVILNSPKHFRAAEKVYRWVSAGSL